MRLFDAGSGAELADEWQCESARVALQLLRRPVTGARMVQLAEQGELSAAMVRYCRRGGTLSEGLRVCLLKCAVRRGHLEAEVCRELLADDPSAAMSLWHPSSPPARGPAHACALGCSARCSALDRQACALAEGAWTVLKVAAANG